MTGTEEPTLPKRHGMTPNDTQFVQRRSRKRHQAQLDEQLNLSMPMQPRLDCVECGDRVMHHAGNSVFYRDDSKMHIAGDGTVQRILKRFIGDRYGTVRPVLLNRQLTERPQDALKRNAGLVR